MTTEEFQERMLTTLRSVDGRLRHLCELAEPLLSSVVADDNELYGPYGDDAVRHPVPGLSNDIVGKRFSELRVEDLLQLARHFDEKARFDDLLGALTHDGKARGRIRRLCAARCRGWARRALRAEAKAAVVQGHVADVDATAAEVARAID